MVALGAQQAVAPRTATGHVARASLSSPLGFSPAGDLQSSAEKIDPADESAVGGGRAEGPSFSPCGSSWWSVPP
ncbi:hypothetical protein MRX96_027366 [Rhipicephalus microplus]